MDGFSKTNHDSRMIVEIKTLELFQKKFAEYVKVKGRYKWQTELNDQACFIYWLNGTNTLYTASQQLSGCGKEALLLKCGSYIDEVFPVGNTEIEAVIIHFYPDLLKQVFPYHFPENLLQQRVPSMPLQPARDALLQQYIESLLLYFHHPALADQELLVLKLKELVLLLCKTQQRQTLSELFYYLFSPEEVSFKEVIEAQLFTNLSLTELAYLTHRSLASFKRDFQKYYQEPPARYLKKRKLEKAARLLRTTPMRISDVVSECGFTNVSHFIKLFRQEFNTAPAAYRLSQIDCTLSQTAN